MAQLEEAKKTAKSKASEAKKTAAQLEEAKKTVTQLEEVKKKAEAKAEETKKTIAQLEEAKKKVTQLEEAKKKAEATAAEAKKTVARLEEAKKKAEATANSLQPKDIEVVFVCDTTGSMTKHIDGVKNNLKGVIDILQLINKRTRIGFVAYKDIVERGHAGTYVTKTYPIQEMTPTSFRSLNQFVDNLSAYVVKNVDAPESLSIALDEAINLSWSRGKTKRIIVVITDASAKEPAKALRLASTFHQDSSASSSKVTVILARNQGRDPNADKFLRLLAEKGGGDYMEDSGQMLNSLIRATLAD